MLFANSMIDFLPPLTALEWIGVLASAALVAVVGRWLLGPSNDVARRWSLILVRGALLAIVAVILLNPVRVDELPGPMQQPELFYLLDASSSMQMGDARSRWEEAVQMIGGAHKQTPTHAQVKAFRFGQRLAAIEDLSQVGVLRPEAGPQLTPAASRPRALLPTDGDTRLLAALRQISSRFGRVPPLGIVLFSDGRARDEAGTEQLMEEFAKLKVPIHVAPVGDIAKGGDIAVSAVVAPPRVRKFTEVEVQVFLRSFGYDGKRSDVELWEVVDGGKVGRKLATLPVTLQSGFQSVSLAFRTDLSTRKLRVAIPAMADEVSTTNNHLDTEMAIDRTKIRVLYVEGSRQPSSYVQVGTRAQIRGPFTDLKTALSEDEDIECVVLALPDGANRLVRIADYGQVDGVRGFPTTIAELSAFDAIVLSDVPAHAFTEKQLEWLEQWIGQRGGGLCMVGGEQSFASGGWTDTPLDAMLPVEMLPGAADFVPGDQVRLVPEPMLLSHPLWMVVSDEKQNREILQKLPGFFGANRFASARPNLTTVLATAPISGAPQAPVSKNEGGLSALGSALQSFLGPQKPAAPKRVEPKPGDDASAAASPALVVGRYGRGRTMALAVPITAPYADEFSQKWGVEDNRYYAKFWRNSVYWLTENSAIGRRRLVASADKRFYRPGETVGLQAATYDESAAPTRNYRVVAMVEPHVAPGEAEPETSPFRWPAELPRTSGEEGPYIVWGEEFELPQSAADKGSATAKPGHTIELPLADALASGSASHSLRIELTAYEDLTQVDSTSLDIQILHDPFEQQNPFPNHKLLERLAAQTGGKVLKKAEDLSAVLRDVPVNVGPPVIKRSPLWSNWWLLAMVLGLLTGEWCWRRSLGLA
jgi:uncharacterized membrane protein